MNALRWTVTWIVVVVTVTSLSAPSAVALGGHPGATPGAPPGIRATTSPSGTGGTLGEGTGPAASAAADAPSVIERAKAAGVPLHDMFLPNFHARPYVRGGVVHPLVSMAPAPMGLGDFGVRNTSGTAVPYVLQSTSWEGTLTLDGIDTFMLDNGGPDTFTVQLNAVTTNTTVGDNTSGSFWIQNVVDYTPSTGSLSLLDNIWNFSNPATTEPASTFFSYNGTPVDPVFYYDVGPSYTVPTPFTLDLYVNTSTTVNATTSIGYSTVRFGYNILNATAGSVAHGVYDTVLFNSTLRAGKVPLT